ncbi:MAG TPA: hypothetical protein VEQ63_08945 [Bryobacteraceae bacterium]|nr:hypothetical protein [Bryobacteraceae bacterium]
MRLPKVLTAGSRYRVSLRGRNPFSVDVVTLRFEDTRLRTETNYVNQQGYHPAEQEKTATLSMWIGDFGWADFSSFSDFRIVDEETGETRFTGPITMWREAVPIPSAVESIEHPGEPSWLLTQPTGLMPPTPEASRLYAATAARLAVSLQKYDPERARRYLESAERAMAWSRTIRTFPKLIHETERSTQDET